MNEITLARHSLAASKRVVEHEGWREDVFGLLVFAPLPHLQSQAGITNWQTTFEVAHLEEIVGGTHA